MSLFRQMLSINGIFSQLTLKSVFVRNYAFKSDLKIKWVRPAKIPAYKPEKSGDLIPMPEIDIKQCALEFKDCKELETANETVKKLFSLEYLPSYHTKQMYMSNLLSQVQRHYLDKGSIEARIARWTSVIRAMQQEIERYPRNKRLKVRLQELIDKRKKHLKYLRRWDYKKFEWVLDNLGIVYKPSPVICYRISRKDSLTKLTDKYCKEIKDERLSEYQEQLAAEQPTFLKDKIRTLEFIRQEQIDCGVEVTVSQEEIDNVKTQLENLIKKCTEKKA